jgi:hypothetical protein
MIIGYLKEGPFDYDKHGIVFYTDCHIDNAYRFPNGSVYLGQWKNQQRWGRGKCSYPNGSIYEGEWAEDMRNGKGRMLEKNGCFYEGDWVNENAEGEGRYTHADGSY